VTAGDLICICAVIAHTQRTGDCPVVGGSRSPSWWLSGLVGYLTAASSRCRSYVIPHPRIPIQPGQIFGSLTALADAGPDARRKSLWRCQCACENIINVRVSDLKYDRVWRCRPCADVSAGIPRSKYQDVILDGTAKTSAEYQSWSSMRWSAMDLYVSLEPDWEDFAVFYADLGCRPDAEESWVLGRIDSDLGYVRDNVQWQPLIHRPRHEVTSLRWHIEGTRYPSANAWECVGDAGSGPVVGWGRWHQKFSLL
jgi:hypothetical protein